MWEVLSILLTFYLQIKIFALFYLQLILTELSQMPKLLFVMQGPFYPDVSGGSELSHLYLFDSLRQLGWQIEVICTRDLPLSRNQKLRSPYIWQSWLQSLISLRMLFSVAIDEELGYPCWRVIRPSRFINKRKWIEFFAKRLRDYQPDVVFSHDWLGCPLLKYAATEGYLAIYFVRNAGEFENGNVPVIPDGFQLLANSPYAASIITEATGYRPEIILPFLQLERYRVSNRQRKYITFINLVPEKGANVAIELARQLPQEKFLFVKGKWIYASEVQNAFLEQASKLPNVEIWEHQQDMRNVYAVTDILLVPSQFNETFGRVIVEAQINSIPVVAANVAGIPYTLGKGGILVEPIDKAQAYVDAVKLLRSDESFYLKKSELALRNSQRPEFNAQYQVQKFVYFVESHIASKQYNHQQLLKTTV
ncbi:glycosyltransferase [Dolichospermum planctonicum UHCC 0167]|uniref:glycosyltransferase n=1 Tax=Dolichospermum planctonicum TaxID=136072 RepID=UPI0014430B6A|nr:glycosyltransferase [Dolichospermum planctonicum]MCW9682210.1 glycosyltransferase [Dolichospermum planctonicum UHCC 0167]